jgi:hypothetical protein
MNCQRCMKNEKAAYRAFSDIIDMNVCAACASEAWSLGLTIEVRRPTKIRATSKNTRNDARSLAVAPAQWRRVIEPGSHDRGWR